MNPLKIRPFFETIYRLRSNEEILLFKKPGVIDTADEQDVIDFLESEWDNECLEYPYTAPDFDKDAALWAARIVYIAAQLLLYRVQPTEDMATVLPTFGKEIQPGSILSADLCLRLLPALLVQATAIDPDDVLISIGEKHLADWHYSGIGYLTTDTEPDLTIVAQHPTTLQLYTDRVIARKDKKRALHPLLSGSVRASMGDHKNYFWKE